jgi:hypothetical protein
MSEEVKNEGESKNVAAPLAVKNNTVKYIVIALVVIAVLGYGAKYVMGMFVMGAVNAKLASEGVHVDGNPMNGGSYTISGKDGATVNVNTNGDGTYNATDEKGNTVTVGAGAKLPDNFPSLAPVYSGATITSSVTSNEGGKAAYSVSMTTKDSYDSVANYYKKALAENGWKTLQSMNMSAQYTMYSAENGTLQLTVMIQGDEKGGDTTLMLTTTEKSQ